MRYEGAGTVEFLVEGGTLSAEAPWYFIEMNTRLQVEHPVTEAITGLDLVEWQLRVASGEQLPLGQDADQRCRATPSRRDCAPRTRPTGFMPSTGPIVAFEQPELEGLRVDSGVEAGSVISPFYDSMIAKLIASAPDRAAGHRAPCAGARGDGGRGPQDQRVLPARADGRIPPSPPAAWIPA